jgi:3-hydroxyisobutyrate dehydrogenase-like beta-hydroxyacid dehydrogenase
MKLGYVGIGLMGLPMTKHLLSRGHSVVAHDIVREKVEAARAAGAKVGSTPAATCAGADAVILNLPTNEAVEEVVFGQDGVASAVKPPQLVVDFSTVKVDNGKRFAAALKQGSGCNWVDAPVSGGPPAAANGSLTVMAGGDPADIERLQPLWRDVAARFTHMGPVGAGLTAKMINQLVVGCGNAVMAEACLLAEAAGIDAKAIPSCLAGGHADSTLLQQIYPRIATRDFVPRGYARQMLKDLEMVNELAAKLHTPLPMMAEALSLYRLLVHLGHSEIDTSGIFKLYEPREEKP